MNASAEVICVGSELLLGQITNTNARFLATELARLGVPHYFQTVVGDNETRIHEALSVAAARSGLLLFTGGLGPTADDLTHESLASYFNVPMVEGQGLWEDLQAKFQARGRVATEIQRKQCLLPAGAHVLPNAWGTAVGLLWEARPGLHILTFPGVPGEMTRMWQANAVPYLKALGWGKRVFHSEILRFWGVGEAQLAQKAHHLLQSTNPTVAPYAQGGEVHLRVTAAAPDVETAQTLMAPVIAELKTLGGAYYFGSDETTLPLAVGSLLNHQGQTVAVAESCTGGLVGQLLTAVAGSSRYFRGGIIAYDNQVKIDLLGVDPALLAQEGAVSLAVACQMAEGVRARLGTDWGVSITGIAGPGGASAGKPVGLVCIAVAGKDGTREWEYRFGAQQGRESVRWLSAHAALDGLRHQINKFSQK